MFIWITIYTCIYIYICALIIYCCVDKLMSYLNTHTKMFIHIDNIHVMSQKTPEHIIENKIH